MEYTILHRPLYRILFCKKILKKKKIKSYLKPSCWDFACVMFGTIHLSYLPTFYLLLFSFSVFLNLAKEMTLKRIEWKKMIYVANYKKLVWRLYCCCLVFLVTTHIANAYICKHVSCLMLPLDLLRVDFEMNF